MPKPLSEIMNRMEEHTRALQGPEYCHVLSRIVLMQLELGMFHMSKVSPFDQLQLVERLTTINDQLVLPERSKIRDRLAVADPKREIAQKIAQAVWFPIAMCLDDKKS